ncbi:MAG: hypothetical protein AB7O38_27305, partial [Pirellulaceae bacterium]
LVRDSGNLSADEALRLQQAKQQQVDQLKTELDELSASYDRAKEQRVQLEAIVKQITRETDEATEALAKSEADLKQLRESNVERRSTYVTWFGILPLPGKKFLELPILDAFNSPRKIENLWSSGLEIDFSHRRVRRFDRCTTCHQLTQKTLPGSALDPAYEPEMVVDFRVDPTSASGESDASEAAPSGDTGETAGASTPEDARVAIQKDLDRLIGIHVADEGLLSVNDATIQFVRPESPASLARASSGGEADTQPVSYAGGDLRLSLLQSRSPVTAGSLPPGLKVGDVIVAINGVPAIAPGKVASGLVDAAMAGRPFLVSVRRGMPNPYTTHPRLDLFVGSMSPHKATEFACTICHEGQGSATAFQWASHTPNTVRQREDWVFNRGWFDNPHWIFPMFPKRFAESACLKCHHEVVELEPSSKFPEPPAEKLVHGYHLITKYGCYGCHEINGYDGPRRIGPDLRLEPNYFAAALQIRNDAGFEKLTDEEKDWVAQIVDHPDRDAVRHRLLESLELDAKGESPRLSAETNDKIVPLLRDVESPGQLRKAGPSLRYVGHKVDAAFLYDWIRDPRHFRPSTRMPKFFGLTRHLEGGPGLEASEQFEPIEILSAVTYLQNRTQPFDYLDPPAGVTEAADVARGKVQFQTRGCLACHTHKTFADANAYRPEDAIVQGPDLSGVGDKFRGEAGQRWLYSWIKEPTRYHPRTVMPNLFLDPMPAGEGKLSDPAADIVAFLLEDSKTGWEPAVGTLTKPTEVNAEHLDRLLIENLAETFSHERAVSYAAKGIPSARRPDLKGAEVELLVDEAAQAEAGFQLSAEQKLMYLGRRTLGKYGCYGCHDVPGFEDAKPIGTTLADWGRKDTARLAFEHINQYIEHAHAGEHAAHATTVADHAAAGTEGGADGEPLAAGQMATADDHGEASEADREFYVEQLKSGHRAGFLYQKLLEPRSYDYHKTENKRYNERLRMPQFPFTVHDREAVVTFVLGLVADPPTEKYIYQPDETSQAVLAGRKVLEKYNCGGCHMLQPQRWQIAFQPERFGEQAEVTTYPFVKSHFDPAALAASAVKDRSGLLRAELSGVPAVDDSAAPIAYDDAGDPLDDESDYRPNQLELPFELWQPSAVDGHGYDVGVLPINVLAENIERRYAADGGFLATYLLRHVVALEKQVNPAAKGTEAWGWLPPPLHGEGNKVQSEWLHNFLLDPHLIRPAAFLRMPRFNMSPAEATALVAYFGAVDGAEFPYAYESRQQAGHLAAKESE